jgi:hypothetical protein
MTAQKWKLIFSTFTILAALVLASACAMIPDTGSGSSAAATQNAQIQEAVKSTATTSAMLTEIASLQTQVARQPTSGASEPTPAPVIPTATAVPPTATQIPTATQVPATPTPSLPCNEIGFIGDVSIPDGSILSPGMYFNKTWRLRNMGSCTWTSGYDLVYVGGDLLGGPSQQAIPANVAPGEVIDLTVSLTAPARDGFYRGFWRLRDASGTLFGVGRKSASFYVDIQVQSPRSQYPLDFAASYCSAEWTSGAGRLPCQGPSDDSRGSVQRIDKPTLENGYVDDEPVLRMRPQMITDGVIRGRYPAFRVENGHYFVTVIGCANKATACDVNFQLSYQIGNGSIETLVTWHEVYDEQYRPVEYDLSGLAGNDVTLILTIQANGSPNQDIAQWLAPRVVKKTVLTPQSEEPGPQ